MPIFRLSSLLSTFLVLLLCSSSFASPFSSLIRAWSRPTGTQVIRGAVRIPINPAQMQLRNLTTITNPPNLPAGTYYSIRLSELTRWIPRGTPNTFGAGRRPPTPTNPAPQGPEFAEGFKYKFTDHPTVVTTPTGTRVQNADWNIYWHSPQLNSPNPQQFVSAQTWTARISYTIRGTPNQTYWLTNNGWILQTATNRQLIEGTSHFIVGR